MLQRASKASEGGLCAMELVRSFTEGEQRQRVSENSV